MILYLDDCFNVFPEIADNSIDLVLCDMPYGTTACKWDSTINIQLMWKEVQRIIKLHGPIVLTSAQPFTSLLVSSNLKAFKYCWYWKKSKATGHLNAKRQPLRNIEEVCVFQAKSYNPQYAIGVPYKGKKRKIHEGTYGAHGGYRNNNPGIRYPNQILEFQSVNKPLHPTQKPLDLMEYLIKTYSNEEDVVLDFCMGSGTTGLACKNLNRKFIGIEKGKKYYDIAVTRINNCSKVVPIG